MKRLFAWNRFSAALALLFPIIGVAQTNLMVNGSFELPAITDASQQTTAVATPTGWAVGTGVGVLINPPYNYFPEAQSGSQLYYIGDGGSHASIQQSVVLSAGQSYQLSFYLAPLIGASWVSAGWDAKVDLTVSDGTQTLLPGLDYSYTVATSVQGWEQKTYSFTAANSCSDSEQTLLSCSVEYRSRALSYSLSRSPLMTAIFPAPPTPVSHGKPSCPVRGT